MLSAYSFVKRKKKKKIIKKKMGTSHLFFARENNRNVIEATMKEASDERHCSLRPSV